MCLYPQVQNYSENKQQQASNWSSLQDAREPSHYLKTGKDFKHLYSAFHMSCTKAYPKGALGNISLYRTIPANKERMNELE